MDEKAIKEIQSTGRIVWVTQPAEDSDIVDKTMNAFNIATEKFRATRNIELLVQTAEAYGRGLFTDHVKDKPVNWTMKDWLNSIVSGVINRIGTGATFTRITDKEVESFVFKSLLEEEADEPSMAALFTYGMLRGLLRSAFPDGEVIMKTSVAQGAPMTGFVFKSEASDEELVERERVKTTFVSIMNKT